MTCVLPVQHSARSSVDNCFPDEAVTNARQLMDRLGAAEVPVAAPEYL
jgi:hypothetical protein